MKSVQRGRLYHIAVARFLSSGSQDSTRIKEYEDTSENSFYAGCPYFFTRANIIDLCQKPSYAPGMGWMRYNKRE